MFSQERAKFPDVSSAEVELGLDQMLANTEKAANRQYGKWDRLARLDNEIIDCADLSSFWLTTELPTIFEER